MAKHWNECHNKDVTNLCIQGVEKIVMPNRGGEEFRILCKKEVFWIFILNTRKPFGLNFEWDVTYFYE